MENIAVRMETVAGCIAKILFKGVTSRTTSRRFGNVQPILCLRKYESPHRNDMRDLTDANSLLSYALCLHISAHDDNFCIRRLEGSAIFKMSACDILVTIGKPFQVHNKLLTPGLLQAVNALCIVWPVVLPSIV